MLDEKTLEDIADIALKEWLDAFEGDLYESLSETFWERDISEGDGAENVIEVEAICKTKLAELRKVLGGTND